MAEKLQGNIIFKKILESNDFISFANLQILQRKYSDINVIIMRKEFF